jgi:parallel beta-helix repeat protein
MLTNNQWCGIWLDYSFSCTVSLNDIADNTQFGVYLLSSSNCTVTRNNITNNNCGVFLISSSGSKFFHNNFKNNAQQAYSYSSTNAWDDGYPSGGNCWSDYQTRYPNATEIDSSGIWNTSYVIDANNIDRYPLMGPFNTYDVGTWNGVAYSVDTVSNSTLSNISFNSTTKTLSFDLTGASGTMGFCKVAIPQSLMPCANLKDWIVTVDGTQVLPPNLNVTTDANYTYIYFTYHQSTETVQITSTSAVPEFQPLILLPLFMIISLLEAIAFKKRATKTRF